MERELLPQEIYDKVCAHLAQQKTRSIVRGKSRCAYRDDRGRSCAVGCLIPNELYSMDMEDCSAGNLMVQFPAFAALVGESNADLLTGLQVAHDLCTNESLLKDFLANAAMAAGLKTGVEQAITIWS